MSGSKFLFIWLLLVVVNPLRSVSQTIDSVLPQFKFYKVVDGTEFSTKDVEAGKKSIFLLFDTSCSHCQDEVESIGKRYSDFKTVHFYLISMDGKSSITTFMNKFGKDLKDKENVTVLQDSNNDFVPKFKPTQFPALYIYSEKQLLIQYFGGQKTVNDIVVATGKD